MANHINLSKKEIAEFCKKNHITELSLFGSVLRNDFNDNSDIDILVKFEHGYKVGFLTLAKIELELTKMLGRKIDLRTPMELSKYFREEVLETAEVQYAKE